MQVSLLLALKSKIVSFFSREKFKCIAQSHLEGDKDFFHSPTEKEKRTLLDIWEINLRGKKKKCFQSISFFGIDRGKKNVIAVFGFIFHFSFVVVASINQERCSIYHCLMIKKCLIPSGKINRQIGAYCDAAVTHPVLVKNSIFAHAV